MPAAPVVLFDLDGTLPDPGTSTISSVRFVLEQVSEPTAPVGVGIVTSKPTPVAERVLDAMGRCTSSDAVAGATLDSTRSAKADVVAMALADLGDLEASGQCAEIAVMIGDRRHDIAGAHTCGLPGVGVTWGYGGRQELVMAAADHIVDDALALREVVPRLLGDAEALAAR